MLESNILRIPYAMCVLSAERESGRKLWKGVYASLLLQILQRIVYVISFVYTVRTKTVGFLFNQWCKLQHKTAQIENAMFVDALVAV